MAVVCFSLLFGYPLPNWERKKKPAKLIKKTHNKIQDFCLHTDQESEKKSESLLFSSEFRSVHATQGQWTQRNWSLTEPVSTIWGSILLSLLLFVSFSLPYLLHFASHYARSVALSVVISLFFPFALHIEHNAQDESETNTNFKSKSLNFGCFLIHIILVPSLALPHFSLFVQHDRIQYTDTTIQENE